MKLISENVERNIYKGNLLRAFGYFFVWIFLCCLQTQICHQRTESSLSYTQHRYTSPYNNYTKHRQYAHTYKFMYLHE